MAKMDYIEPSGYFTPSMKKILAEGEKKMKNSAKKSTVKKDKKTSKKK